MYWNQLIRTKSRVSRSQLQTTINTKILYIHMYMYIYFFELWYDPDIQVCFQLVSHLLPRNYFMSKVWFYDVFMRCSEVYRAQHLASLRVRTEDETVPAWKQRSVEHWATAHWLTRITHRLRPRCPINGRFVLYLMSYFVILWLTCIV